MLFVEHNTSVKEIVHFQTQGLPLITCIQSVIKWFIFPFWGPLEPLCFNKSMSFKVQAIQWSIGWYWELFNQKDTLSICPHWLDNMFQSVLTRLIGGWYQPGQTISWCRCLIAGQSRVQTQRHRGVRWHRDHSSNGWLAHGLTCGQRELGPEVEVVLYTH